MRHVENTDGFTATVAGEPPGVPVDERWEAVLRISSSRAFEKSPRIRELLLFVARKSFDGQTEQLSEYEIGRAVFGRIAGYVPTEDSIVRSSIRQLRRKLVEYYESDGQTEHERLEIPKGSYVARFRKPESDPAVPPVVLPAPAVQTSDPPGAPAVLSMRRLALPGILVLSLLANIVLITRAGLFSGSASASGTGLVGALVSRSSQPTQLVLDDYAYVLLNRMSGRKFTLDDYVHRAYADPAVMPSRDAAIVDLWELLSTRYLVSLGSVGTVERILRTVPDQKKIVIRHARNLSGRDFKSGNLILFASPPNNPWSQLFEDKLNFRLSRSGRNAEFTNVNPKAGEQHHYAAEHVASANSGIGYARIAFIPGTADNTFLLLLTGLNMVTAEAAAEYATNPRFVPELLKQLGARNLAEVPHFEALLKTSSFDSTPRDVSLLASRKLD